jgi:hypothetical protein
VADDSRIQVVIELDDGSVKQGFLRMERAADESAGNISKFFKRAGEIAAGITLEKAFHSFFHVIKDGFRESIAAAREHETALNRLSNSLSTAGTFSRQAVNEFVELADKIQRTTTVQDGAALSLAALARNYTRTNEQAKLLTITAIDVSTQLGIDLDAAVRQVGSTFSGFVDPRGGLTRTVLGLKDLTVNQLRAGEGLDLIAKRFQGAAENEVKTFSGALAQLKNSFNGLQENFGDLVIKSPAVLAVFKVIKDTINSLKTTLASFNAGDKDIFKPIILSAINLGQALNTFIVIPFKITFDAVTIIVNTFSRLFVSIVGKIAGTASQLAGFFAPDSELYFNLKAFNEQSKVAFDQLGESSQRSAESIRNAFSGEDAASLFLKNLQTQVEATSGSMIALGENTKNGAETSEEALSSLALTANQLGNIVSNSIKNSISKSIQLVVQNIVAGKNAFAGLLKTIGSIFGDMLITIGETVLLAGIGMEAIRNSIVGLTGGPAIFAGIALIAAGSLLKALSGGGEASSVPTTSASGGGSTTTPINEPAVVDDKAKQRIVVNVQGDVLDSRESGLRIVELINDAFDTQGAQVTARA